MNAATEPLAVGYERDFHDGVGHLPNACPYALEQVPDFDWLPRHEAGG